MIANCGYRKRQLALPHSTAPAVSKRRVRILLVPTKVREAIRMIEADGWMQVKATSGTGHRQFKHPIKPGRVTISGKPGDDLAPGTFNSILKQAGLK